MEKRKYQHVLHSQLDKYVARDPVGVTEERRLRATLRSELHLLKAQKVAKAKGISVGAALNEVAVEIYPRNSKDEERRD